MRATAYGWNGDTNQVAAEKLFLVVLQSIDRSDDGRGQFARFRDELAEKLVEVEDLSIVALEGSDAEVLAAARRLGIELGIEFSYRATGERVRINAQVIYLRTDEHLWAESYDQPLDSVS